MVVALSGAVAAALALSGAVADLALTHEAAKMGNAAVIRVFFDVSRLTFILVWIPAPVMIGTTSLVALRSNLLPRWLAWAGVLTAAVMLISTFATFADTQNILILLTFIGFILFALWVLATSITLYRRGTSRAALP